MSETPAPPFASVPASWFPFTAELADAATRTRRWPIVVTGAAGLRVPARGEVNCGRPLIARIIRPDGEITECEL